MVKISNATVPLKSKLPPLVSFLARRVSFLSRRFSFLASRVSFLSRITEAFSMAYITRKKPVTGNVVKSMGVATEIDIDILRHVIEFFVSDLVVVAR